MRRVKIVCTLGPASSGRDAIRALVDAGMDVARLNFSHGDREDHSRAFQDVRGAARDAGRAVAVLADLSGPKMRFGEMEGGAVRLVDGERTVLTTRDVLGAPDLLPVQCDIFPEGLESGDAVFADDGKLQFVVDRCAPGEIHCTVRQGGLLTPRKGLNIPNLRSAKPALTEKDRRDVAFGLDLGVDYFAMSFVRHARDVVDVKSLAGAVPVVAKIEKPEAIEHLDAICDVADGLMVARGDLGIEAGFEKVPLLQKRLIRAMNRRAKPVVTATQMLESMVHSRQPTRAEVSDVANAVLDGADAVMLSGESAVGDHPVLVVQTMARIIEEVERAARADGEPGKRPDLAPAGFGSAIATAAAGAAAALDLGALAVYSLSGRSVALLSAYRPRPVVAGFSNDESVVRRMALYWGVAPFLSPWFHTTREVVAQTERALREAGVAAPGEKIAITFGLRDGGPEGTTTLKLWEMGAAGDAPPPPGV